MFMKGVILPDHSPGNKYQVIIPGFPLLTPTTLGALEDELQKTEMPDKTAASGGESKAVEVDMTIPLHHKLEMAAMEVWYQESHDPVLPSYKKAATIIYYALSGAPVAIYNCIGVFPIKRGLPEQDMEK